MTKSSVELTVMLPASLLADEPDLQQKTLKVGSIGRALAIFRVNKVCIYNDDDPHVKSQAAEAELIASLLRYMETPQYLRKLLCPRTKELRYAGLLPPLRTPHHPLRGEKNRPGDYREGVIVETSKNQSLLEIGLLEKGVLNEKLEVGHRLTVKLGERMDGRILVGHAKRTEISEYWGFEVSTAKSLADALNGLKADYVIGTSRYGRNLNEAIREMGKRKPNQITIVFGGSYQGLFQICEKQGVEPQKLFDVMVNTIPDQGTETVRTEEALLATLALLNTIIWRK